MDITNKNILTFQEAVKYTGYKASYLYKLTASGTIPVYKPTGKLLFFKREELELFLTSNR